MALKRGLRRRVPQTHLRSDSVEGEKRVFSRVECLVDLELEHDHIEPVEALDLSLQGLGFHRCSLSDPLPLGRTVSVGLPGFAPVEAQVRWDDGSRVGVRFSGHLHDIVNSWVGEVMAAQGVRLGDLVEAIRS